MDTILSNGKIIPVSLLKKNGFFICRISGRNRKINKNHVKKLMISATKSHGFLSPITLISAEDYLNFLPDKKITLAGGKEITPDSPDLPKVLIILDGQHRAEAEEELSINEQYEPTLMAQLVNLPEGMTPDEWTTTINTTSKNWDSRDRTDYINTIEDDENTNIAIAARIQDDYGIGPRHAIAILNFNDNYRKQHQIDYMENPENGLPAVLKGTQENQKRGLEMLHAMEVGYRNSPKALRKMATIKFVIEIYQDTSDKEKVNAVNNLKLFLMTIKSDIGKEIATNRSEADNIRLLRSEWRKFSKSIKTEGYYSQRLEESISAEHEWTKIEGNKNNKIM